MGAKTGISWCDATWNPVRGCSRVSEGCRHCYAERVASRFSGFGQPYDGLIRNRRWNGTVRMVPEHLADPLRWKKPRRIFVNSMSDLFHESLTNEQIAAVFGVMAAAPRHTFQVLTKRARRMREWFEWAREEIADAEGLVGDAFAMYAGRELGDGSSGDADDQFERVRQAIEDAHEFPAGAPWPLPNVWLGVSIENQAAADERIPDLLATPAAVRFLSCEPLLGEVDLDQARCDRDHCGPDEWGVADDGDTPWCNEHDQELSFGHWLHADGGIDWVIAGCESGPGARPAQVEWFRSLRDQCKAAGVAFWLKQARMVDVDVNIAGETIYSTEVTAGSGSKRKAGGVIELPYLDGVQHAAMPECAR